jgi:hypothetical protein
VRRLGSNVNNAQQQESHYSGHGDAEVLCKKHGSSKIIILPLNHSAYLFDRGLRP